MNAENLQKNSKDYAINYRALVRVQLALNGSSFFVDDLISFFNPINLSFLWRSPFLTSGGRTFFVLLHFKTCFELFTLFCDPRQQQKINQCNEEIKSGKKGMETIKKTVIGALSMTI